MLLSDFNYHLPEDRIAQEQAVPRDSARLMLINRVTQEISHHHIYDLPALLPKDYFIVANNTKVFPARIFGTKPTGGKVEILLTQPLGQSRYKCIARPGLKVGDIILFPAPEGSDLEGSAQPADSTAGRSDPTGLIATVISVNEIERTIQFNQEESILRTTLSQIGTMPTPPYIKKLLGNSKDYQTIYAKYGFSAAAPTAGLHFTPDLLKQIKGDLPAGKAGHSWNELTLNVGLGTFLPVKEKDIKDHHMHEESYTISPTTAEHIKSLKSFGQKLLSIGTTTMRALESNPKLAPGHNNTSIFMYPPYQFKLTDALMTNFHLPGSTLLMLVSAFCTYPNSKEKFTTFSDSLLGRAYQIAIQEKYRFFSFGDAMLII
ncbi:tRNA preQ1(34) S-adenosylmethionine ribosyltransferase-isomerase QueA [Candidatus Woesebacteria bacterium]|nr:tRNA preQ1(34) S-adenosylmethionine ribosyltransferase-isomerase QueA [Candidatus Woesebacteria bacterium]